MTKETLNGFRVSEFIQSTYELLNEGWLELRQEDGRSILTGRFEAEGKPVELLISKDNLKGYTPFSKVDFEGSQVTVSVLSIYGGDPIDASVSFVISGGEVTNARSYYLEHQVPVENKPWEGVFKYCMEYLNIAIAN